MHCVLCEKLAACGDESSSVIQPVKSLTRTVRIQQASPDRSQTEEGSSQTRSAIVKSPVLLKTC